MIILTVVIISGCAENNKDKSIHGNATVENLEIQIIESNPVKVNVTVKGYRSDACTEFDKIVNKRENNIFHISITTIKSADVSCENLPYFFEQVIPIETNGLNPGIYYVTVNGVNGSFELTANNNTAK